MVHTNSKKPKEHSNRPSTKSRGTLLFNSNKKYLYMEEYKHWRDPFYTTSSEQVQVVSSLGSLLL